MWRWCRHRRTLYTVDCGLQCGGIKLQSVIFVLDVLRLCCKASQRNTECDYRLKALDGDEHTSAPGDGVQMKWFFFFFYSHIVSSCESNIYTVLTCTVFHTVNFYFHEKKTLATSSGCSDLRPGRWTRSNIPVVPVYYWGVAGFRYHQICLIFYFKTGVKRCVHLRFCSVEAFFVVSSVLFVSNVTTFQRETVS